MADTYKRLGSVTFAVNNEPKILYQTAVGKSAILSNITLVNTNTSVAKEALISIDPTFVPQPQMSGYVQADAQRIYLVTLQPGETVILEPGITIGDEHTIIVSGLIDVVVSAFGLETDDTQGHYKMFEMLDGGEGKYVPVPLGMQHLYRSILLHNSAASTDEVSLKMGTAYGESTGTFIYSLPVGAGETVAIKLGIGAASQQSLIVSAQLSNIKVFGVELSG